MILPKNDVLEPMKPPLKEIRHNPLLWLLAFVPAGTGAFGSRGRAYAELMS
jgi:hypothetical protein